MLNLILLQAEAGAQQGNQWGFWVMMALIFVVFYFFMIRPQTKKQKELQKQRDNMKKGDKVVTAGGLYGEIKEVQENTFLVTIAKDVTIKIAKESVFADAADAQQAPKDAPAEKK
ncbi:MAG: preprotein translocase subunit YajC [Paludibacteraceae bacterium]